MTFQNKIQHTEKSDLETMCIIMKTNQIHCVFQLPVERFYLLRLTRLQFIPSFIHSFILLHNGACKANHHNQVSPSGFQPACWGLKSRMVHVGCSSGRRDTWPRQCTSLMAARRDAGSCWVCFLKARFVMCLLYVMPSILLEYEGGASGPSPARISSVLGQLILRPSFFVSLSNTLGALLS